jgi:hypothetical protein
MPPQFLSGFQWIQIPEPLKSSGLRSPAHINR